MAADQDGKLNEDIFDALARLFGQMIGLAEAISAQFGVPMFCIKALRILDATMPMKELGQRMRCDPSFVTAIADALEERGLATREPNMTDRRVKNLVLSTEGLELKRLMEKEMVGRMPWSRALDMTERESFLALILKLIEAAVTEPASDADRPDTDESRPASSEAATPAGATASAPGTPAGPTPPAGPAAPADPTASAPGTPADATASSAATPNGGGRAGEVTVALDTASVG